MICNIKNLGLIVLLILIISISLMVYYNSNKLEGNTNMEKEEDFISKQLKYYKSREIPALEEGITKELDFFVLREGFPNKGILKTEQKGDAPVKLQISKDIERCRALNKVTVEERQCEKLEDTKCGYCNETKEIIYGNNSQALDGVCENGWVGPGLLAVKSCTKYKEQEKCSKIKDCGDATGICGWCPISQKGMPSQKIGKNGWIPKYDDDECNWGDSDLSFNGGSLIKNIDCQKLGQLYPCIGENALGNKPDIGHSDACYQDLYDKAGCKGNYKENLKKANVDLNKKKKEWNTFSYITLGNTFKNIFKLSKQGGNEEKYKEAKENHMKCYGTKIRDPCNSKYNPRPMDCLNKLYNETGCNKKGKLNPAHGTKYVGNGLSKAYYENSIRHGKTSNKEFKDVIKRYRNEANNLNIGNNALNKYDRAIYVNELCYGKRKDYPLDKPCWNDFKVKMLSHDNVIQQSNNTLKFDNNGGIFKNLLPYRKITLPDKPKPQKIINWETNYTLSKSNYDNENFPYWNFLNRSKMYWKRNWNKFSRMLRALREVDAKPNRIIITNEGRFKYVLKEYKLIQSGETTTITRNIYNSNDFPYWEFIKIVKRI